MTGDSSVWLGRYSRSNETGFGRPWVMLWWAGRASSRGHCGEQAKTNQLDADMRYNEALTKVDKSQKTLEGEDSQEVW